MEYTYLVDGEGLSGSVVLTIPKYKERLALVKRLAFSANEVGEMEKKPEAIDSAMIAYEELEKHVVSVTVAAGGIAINSLDDLGMYAEGSRVINKLMAVMTNGVSLGKD